MKPQGETELYSNHFSRNDSLRMITVTRKTLRGYDMFIHPDGVLLGWATIRKATVAEKTRVGYRGRVFRTNVYNQHGEFVGYGITRSRESEMQIATNAMSFHLVPKTEH